MSQPSLRTLPRIWPRHAGGVAASVAVTAVGAVIVAAVAIQPKTPDTGAVGKMAQRLSYQDDAFVEEDVPVRRTRVYDALAMFALPQTEPAAWSDRPAPVVAVLEPASRPAASERPRLVPRMVSAAAADPHRMTLLPPSRPDRLAVAARPSAVVAAAEPPTAAPAGAPAREPVRILGWALPGTQYLPGRSDASHAASVAGGAVVSVGGRAADTIGETAARLGSAARSVGSTLVETVGLD